jgi:hypothetical protein
MRCAGIKRNDPKVKASSSIGQSLPEAFAIGTDSEGFSQARGIGSQAVGHARWHLQTDAKTPLHNFTIVNATDAGNSAKLLTANQAEGP